MSASPRAGSPGRDPDSDCDSDSSEVLSVGHEPPPTLADLEPGRERPPGSPSPDARPAPSPPSPGSSGYAPPAPQYREPGLDYAALAYARRAPPPQPLGVSVLMRLSLSPPLTAALHPGLLGPAPPAAPLHRLPVGRLLQREEQPEPRNGGCPAAAGHNAGPDGRSSLGGLQPGHRGGNGENLAGQGSLKFSIDNILKADFGRRITEPISLKKARPKKPAARPIDLSKDFLESSSEGSERGSETSSTRNASPNLPSPAPSATSGSDAPGPKLMQWPAWVYCTRYSDRPSSGPRTRKRKRSTERPSPAPTSEEKRPRTAFSAEQLARLRHEFTENKYLTEQRRQTLSKELGLNEAQIKIWFQNKRAKIKKASGQKNPLALQLMAQGLYNHSTVPLSKEELEQAAELQAK